jgi:rhodanese-related sulfurtransferase
MPTAFAEIPRVSPDEAKRSLETGDPVIVVDVRSSQAYERGHIAGARSVPLNKILRGASDLPKDRDLLLYCSCIGEAEAAWAGALLRTQGYTRVFVIRNGLMGWSDLGYPMSLGQDTGLKVDEKSP